jgi:hypothetical protein
MRIKTRLKHLEKVTKHLLSKENEIKVGFRVVELGKRTTPFQYTSIGSPYAELLSFFTLVHLHEMELIDSLNDVCGRDALAWAENCGIYKNSEGLWETRPDIEHALISRFLEENHRRLGNDPQWIKSLRERLECLQEQI